MEELYIPARDLAQTDGKEFEHARLVDVQAQETLVVRNAQRGESLVEVHVQPVHADVQVAS